MGDHTADINVLDNLGDYFGKIFHQEGSWVYGAGLKNTEYEKYLIFTDMSNIFNITKECMGCNHLEIPDGRVMD